MVLSMKILLLLLL